MERQLAGGGCGRVDRVYYRHYGELLRENIKDVVEKRI